MAKMEFQNGTGALGAIYWESLCGSASLDWAFWSDDLTVNTNDPDLTLCFQYTMLHWLPAVFLLCVSAFHLWDLRRMQSKPGRGVSLFNLAKCVLLLPMMLLMVMDFFRAVTDASSGLVTPAVMYVYPILMLLVLLLVLFITYYEYRKGVHSSGLLFLFWLLELLCSIVILRSKIRYESMQLPNTDGFRLVTWSTFVAFAAVQFVAQLFVDRGALAQHGGSRGRSYNETTDETRSLLQRNEPEKMRPYMKRFVKHNLEPCPELSSSFLSQISFYWLTGMIIRGYKRALTGDDLWALLDRDTCGYIVPLLQKFWKQEQAKAGKSHQFKYTNQMTSNGLPVAGGRPDGYQNAEHVASRPDTATYKPSFLRVLGKVFGWPYFIAGIWKLAYDLINFAQPQLLSLLILFIQNGDPYEWRGYFLAVALFLVALFKTFIFQQYYHGTYTTGMRLRTAVIAAVYRKALRLSSSARKNKTVGEIVNLMSVDAQKLQDAPAFLHQLWGAPIIIALALYFLWLQLGPSVLAGLFVMVLLIPVNGIIASRIRKLQISQMKWKDQRIKVMNEVLNGIKVLKLYAWEAFFDKGVREKRDQELKLLLAAAYLNAASAITWFCAPFLVALATFAVYVLSSPENILDANKAFVSLTLFNIMNFPLSILPGAITYLVTSLVSVGRITSFLNADEVDPDAVDTSGHANDSHEFPVQVHKGDFKWGPDEPLVLKDVNLKIPNGKLVAIVGSVGAGKTSLVSALLGELVKTSGSVSVTGTVGYVPQQAWCQNATLRDNITFGKAFQKTTFERVISACALKPDIKILPGGLETEIGEKGINLSGGQKQRISLARAVYSDTDLYFLDDPLSAVDSHVGKHIFEQVLGPSGLLSNKTRLLVTHGISFLPKMDLIVVLKDGSVSEVGTYSELLQHNGGFAEFIQQYLEEEDDEEEGDEETSGHGSASFSGAPSRRRSKVSVTLDDEANKVAADGRQLIQEESSETGSVKLSVFKSYVRSFGFGNFAFSVLTYALFIACQVGQNLWLSEWSQDEAINGTQDTALRDLRLGVYGAIGGGQAIFVLLQNIGIALGTYWASKVLHDDILDNIMKTPLSFFDITPIGRIINRFGKDIDTVDVSIPLTLRIWLMTFGGVVGTIIIIGITTKEFILLFIPLLVLYYFAQRFYVCTSRQLKRIDSVRRSPIYSHFQETIVGASCIRAFGKQQDFVDKSDYLVDWNQMAWYPSIVSNRWLQISLEGIGNFVILFTAVFAVASRYSINAGLAGLAVSYALQVTSSLNYVVRMTCDLETYIVAVERIKEYVEVPTEAPWYNNAARPRPGWPDSGRVEFKNYSVRYRPGLDLVLRDICAAVQPGEKVGIVGRTGAGKSSLTLALFRILEPAGGRIEIDGVDIASLGLHDLRSKLTIIPQDPVLFSGSLRYNLDPAEEHSDAEVWKSIELAHLKEFVAAQPAGLEFVCSEGGENMSVGQRQLVCLARALLRKTKILVLDEATAAIDLETDDLIQQTIRREFKACS
uniref:ABC-type glutathione-S-conjugate transporter n=1 Tax=Macrostomum lignano TaxID=282301 RepID=A0A1I8HV06_9PLAT